MEPGTSDAGTASLAAFVADPEWPVFRQTLIGLTDVTRSHFGKLVEVCLASVCSSCSHIGPAMQIFEDVCCWWSVSLAAEVSAKFCKWLEQCLEISGANSPSFS